MFHMTTSSRWLEWVKGGGWLDERGRVHTGSGMNRENWERQMREREVEWWGGHCTSTNEMRDRGERVGVRWGWKRETALTDSPGRKSRRLTVIIVPSLQTCCCRLLRATPLSCSLQTRIHESIHCWHAGCAALTSRRKKQKGRDKEGDGVGARERLDQAMICVSSQRYSSSPRAPLLAASYSLSFCFSTSPSRSTHACSCCMATTC